MHDLIDIGANLTHDSFDRDRDEVIARAAKVGVGRMIVTGASRESCPLALELAVSHPGILYATAGIHPHHATELDVSTASMLHEFATRDEVVAVGECGLDYFRNFSPADTQRSAFATQLSIAAASGKPVFLHQRDAHDDFVAILNEHLPDLHGGVAHCFTGGPLEMAEYLEMGFYIGITGWICDERRGHDLQAAVRDLPLNRVMIETDAPYLMPRDLPEKLSARRNEPVVLPHILQALAGYMNCDIEELAKAVTLNSEKLFGLHS
jgi:TatD DNase family protein